MAAGNKQVLDRLSKELATLQPRVVVDIGGGTGTVRELLPQDCRYVCLDFEMPKLRRFRTKVAGGLAILGNAAAIPISDGSSDMVICKAVTHHLTDRQLDQALDESRRVLRSGGKMVLLDAILNRRRLAGVTLWRLDRGSFPRMEAVLQECFAKRFRVARWDKFSVYHEYVLAI